MSRKIAIFGAAGKMGSGIAELFLQTPLNQLVCIDSNEQALLDSKSRFRKHLRFYGEKNINHLRELYKNNPNLISNQEVIEYFIEQQFDKILFTTLLEEAQNAEWIFEAIVEDVEQKVHLFRALHKIVPKSTLFFSNTSAIPIHELNSLAGLEHRIIGFHFYNPPTQNKMLEIVVSEHLKPIAESLAQDLKRTYVFSGDVPGFIGNGHFIRELKFALDLNMPGEEVDKILEEELLRPFGLFKLAHFIGIPTVLAISKIMGIDCHKLALMPKQMGPLKPHKIDPKTIRSHFENLKNPIAKQFLRNSKEIGNLLVEIKAAPDLASVEKVLKVGFQHPYGFEYAHI